MPDQKRAAVEAFRSLGYRVLAAGDSYNDTSMLLAADAGYLFHAPPNVVADFPQLEPVDDFDDDAPSGSSPEAAPAPAATCRATSSWAASSPR